MTISTRTRRAATALVGATALVIGVAGAGSALGAADPSNPHPPSLAPDPAAVASIPAGSEKQFVPVAPCRIIDTRESGGALVAGQRVFDATLANYAVQGGKAGSCNIPSYATSVQLNLGAISRNDKTSDIKGWATGTAEPLASLLNYNPSGPVANMVTMPVNGAGQFTLKTPGAAHIFADVAGYFVKPLYVAVNSDGSIWQGKASGVTSVARTSTGRYTVTFERDVKGCAPAASDYLFSTNHDVSPDNDDSYPANVVQVGIANAANAATDARFFLSMTC
jgi:hypothetical protein